MAGVRGANRGSLSKDPVMVFQQGLSGGRNLLLVLAHHLHINVHFRWLQGRSCNQVQLVITRQKGQDLLCVFLIAVNSLPLGSGNNDG